jgi:signal peptidase I
MPHHGDQRRSLSVNDLDLIYGIEHSANHQRTRNSIALQRTLVSIFETAVQTILIFIIVSSMMGRFEIHQTSMEPTFHEGQRVVVSQLGSALPAWLYRTVHAADTPTQAAFSLKRGHVVVFYDTVAKEGPPLIKRLIGLPGETIAIHDGSVFVNDVRIDEPYLHNISTTCHTYCGPLTLGDNEYFFMGDNRPGSRDSRSFGAIPEEQIIGRVILRYWPLNEMSLYE